MTVHVCELRPRKEATKCYLNSGLLIALRRAKAGCAKNTKWHLFNPNELQAS